jgi:hypothetical protein
MTWSKVYGESPTAVLQTGDDYDDDVCGGEDQVLEMIQTRLPMSCCAVLTRRFNDAIVTNPEENELDTAADASYDVHQDVSTSRNT